jgi:hypothetical protein
MDLLMWVLLPILLIDLPSEFEVCEIILLTFNDNQSNSRI